MKYFFFLFFICSIQSFAQINTDKFRQDEDSLGLSGNTAINFFIRSGNTEIYLLGSEGRINYNGGDNYTFFVFKGDYGWQRGDEFSNNLLGHLRHVRMISHFAQLELFGQMDYNKSRLLLFRNLFGLGGRFKVFTNDILKIRLGLGYMYEREKYDLSENSFHPLEANVHRSTNYLSVNFSSDNANISSITYFQPEIGNWGDIRILQETSLIVGMTKFFDIEVKFNLRYDSRPPDEINNLDTETKFGFIINF